MTTKQMLVTISLLATAGIPLAASEPAAITAEQAAAILSELRQIRALLDARRPEAGPQGRQGPTVQAKLKLGDEPVLGDKAAPLTMVEFVDMRCGYCKQFHNTAFLEIRKKLIETGKVRFVSRDLPLDVSSPSLLAAETVRCAGEQQRYWPLRDALMTSKEPLTAETITSHAKAAALDIEALNACVDSGRYRPAIEQDLKEAAALEIGGTPTFVIGKSTVEGVEGVTVVGALSYEAFEKVLQKALEK